MIRSGSITVVDLTDIDTIENWYLATDQSSGVTRNTEGWTTTVQMMDSSHPYLWTYEITKGSGNVVINTTEPVIIGRYGTDGSGTDGRGIVQIDDYYAINNSTTEPVDGEFTTTVVNPTPINKYLWNYEVTTYTDSTTESTEKRIIGVYGDKPVITSNPKQDGVTTILADGTAIATIADGTDGHSPTITTSKAVGSTTTKILADGVEIGSVEDGNDGHSPVVTASKSDGVTTIQVDGNIVSTINDGNSVRISSATKQDGVTTIVLTDESGSQTLTIVDGEDGSDGQPGRDGANSYLHIAWANDTSGTDFSTSDSTNKLYMGTYSDSTIADSTDYRKYNWSKIKGEQGATGAQGTSVVKTEIEYYMKVQGGVAPDSSTTGSTIIPNYEPGSTYYKRTVTYLSDNTSFKGNWIQDTGLTNEIKNAYDAWVAAGTAEQRTKKIITDSNGVTVAAGVNGADVTEGTTSTYGYNTIMAPNYLGLRYNDINLSKLTTTGLDFYIPTMNSTTPVQGNKGLELTSNAITFYNPNTNQAQLIIGANGTLQSGNYTRGSNSKFSSNGTKIDLINGDIITKYFRVSQGLETGLNAGVYVHGTIEALDGTIGTDSTNYWEIGNDTDYNLNSTAKIIGHGSSFIQLGDSSTWRLATNRIHTGWHVESDKLLHFPKFTDGTNTLYWDYGLHSPTEKGDKFLYIRTASGTAQLSNLLYDIDDSYATPQWDYKFYIDGEGNIHAGDIYSHGTLISGTSAPYLLKSGGTITGNLEVNGTLTKGSKNVAYLTATPTSGQILIADGISGGIKSSGYTIATSVPSGALFTDKKVQTSQANTTKLYLVGTNTLDTSTDVLNFDSNIYADTTAGALHATTYNGYTLAAASAKGVDEGTSMPASVTDNNVPTTQLMKSFVEGKGYITSYTETDPVFSTSVASGITGADITNWNSKTTNTGTVESVTVQGSNGLTGSGTVTTTGTITISHEDTSSQASSSNSGRTYIQSITLDGYGHVTGLSTATETVTDTHYTTHLYVGKSNSTGNVATTTTDDTYLRLFDDTTARESHKLSGSNGLTITSDANGHITFNSPSAFTAVEAVNIGTTASPKYVLRFTKSGGGTTDVSTENIAVIQSEGANKLVTAGTTTGIDVTGPVKFSGGVPVQMTAANGDSIPWGLIAGAPNTYTPAAHVHGNITNDGDITAIAPTITSGDQIIINDNSTSKITNGPTFDGSTTTKALTPKGTWETFSQFSGSYNDLDDKPTIPTVPSNIVNTITTTAGAHTVISNQKGNVSFNIPTTAAHVGIKFGYTTSGNNRAVLQDSNGNLYVIQKDDNTNYYHTTGSWGGTNNLTYTATANGGAGALAFTLATASTSAYGVTKLSSTASSTEQALAATPKLVYDSINNATNKYVTLDTNQTLTAAGTKTYLGLQTYGTNGLALGVTSGTNVTQKANMKYDSTLEAIVFSFT